MIPRFPVVAVSALLLLNSAQAVLLPVTAQYKRSSKGDRRRGAQTGMLTLGDENDISYVAQITAGGKTFTVSLDTGSSDLNIEGNVPGAQDQAIQIPVTFAVGELDGALSFVDVEFGGYAVQNQIFNHVPTQQNNGSQGLLGLGPSYASVLWNTAQPYIQAGRLPRNSGDSLLDRIFQADSGTGNCIAIYMSRNLNPEDNTIGQGVFTIAEVLSQYQAVMNMPVLPVVDSSNMLEQHFAVVLDGVIGNNGQPVSLPPSLVPGVPRGKMVAIFDTGYTFPQVPEAIATAIYGGITGAKKQTLGGGVYWTMPCDQVVNAAFVFSGNSIPIHPLDLNFDGDFLFSELPEGTCVGAFQPITDAAASALDGQADMILGMAFLRNVYSVFNYGDWIDSSMDQQYEPFVQLLGITDLGVALNEFHSVRTGGSGTSHLSALSVNLSTTPAVSQTTNNVLDWIKSHLYIFIPAVVGGVIVIALLITWCCFCCRRERAQTAYRNIDAPAPGHGPNTPPQNYRHGSSPFNEKRYDMGYSHRSPAPAYDDPYHNRSLLEKESALWFNDLP